MAKYSGKTVRALAETYWAQQKKDGIASEIEVEILPRENVVDPMLLLKTLESDRNIDALTPLANALLTGTKVRFTCRDKVLSEIDVAPGMNLGHAFVGKPYLLQALFNTVYGLMVGKLTVPSSVLNELEGSMAEPPDPDDKQAKKK
jgi:hypothetical protein